MGDTRAKIVCTLGPASHDQATNRRMDQAGMNVAKMVEIIPESEIEVFQSLDSLLEQGLIRI